MGDGLSGAGDIAAALGDARARTLSLVADLDDAQLLGPKLPIVNPLRWEIGHLAWFQEKWVLRRSGAPSILPGADALYDSSAVPHDTRWDLPLPSRQATLDYMAEVLAAILDRLARAPRTREDDLYFHFLALFHEDMHAEAFAYTRQTLGYPPPSFARRAARAPGPRPKADGGGAPPATPARGDVEVPGGALLLGASPGARFVFDNEKWAHPVRVEPFRMARYAVTEGEFAAFVDHGGYGRREWWSEAGWAWREGEGAVHPVYWRREPGGGWSRRTYDRWEPIEPDLPVLHVNAHEAEAFCRWAGRRLPTEAEWEFAASADSGMKRPFPWGDAPPSPERANLDGAAGGCVPVDALAAGDGPFGCRQMIGNVWEWTASDFQPYPGFTADPYKEYSAPWFGNHRVLRGGCWVTRSRLIRNTWRNFYTPDRRDVWAGFRTCAAEPHGTAGAARG